MTDLAPSAAANGEGAAREATLLSGAVIAQRPLMLADQNRLTVAARRRSPKIIDDAIRALLKNTTTTVLDAGPYAVTADGHLPWDRVLSGDRMDAMINLRAASYPEGEKALCEVRCSSCGEVFGWEVEVETDLIRRPYTPEAIERVRTGDPFEATVGAYTVTFVLNNGQTEQKYRRIADDHPDRDLSVTLRARILDVTGPEGKVPRTEIMDWLDGGNGRGRWPGLTAAQAEDLRAAMDAVDGGYDTEIEAYHPACGGRTVFDLPFEVILAPSKKIRERRLQRRRGRS